MKYIIKNLSYLLFYAALAAFLFFDLDGGYDDFSITNQILIAIFLTMALLSLFRFVRGTKQVIENRSMR